MESTAAVSPDFVRLIYCLAWRLYHAPCAGSQHCRQLADELRNPKPGDLVIEASAIAWREKNNDWNSGIGRLICKRNEFVPFKEESGGYHDDFTYIESLDGTLQRWSNCDFAKVPEHYLRPDHNRRPTPDFGEWVADALIRHELN
jgi:hypothetical protein